MPTTFGHIEPENYPMTSELAAAANYNFDDLPKKQGEVKKMGIVESRRYPGEEMAPPSQLHPRITESPYDRITQLHPANPDWRPRPARQPNWQDFPTYRGSIYLGGPITGLTYGAARHGWREDFAALMPPGITVLSPMRHEGHLKDFQGPLGEDCLPTHAFSQHRMIMEKAFLDIRTCDIMLAHFLAATAISRGTLVEIGYALGQSKPVVLVMGPGNIHDSIFVSTPALCILPTIQEAAEVCSALLSEGV